MGTLETLVGVLSREYGPDYWYDDVVLYAADLVAQLSSAEWEQLSSTWRNCSRVCQEHLAEALSGAQAGRESLLTALLASPHPPVALAAAGSLTATRDWAPGSPEREVLTLLRELVDPAETGVIDELLSRGRV